MSKLVHSKQIDIVCWATESGNKSTKPIDLAKYAIKIKTMPKLYLFRLKEHGKQVSRFTSFMALLPTHQLKLIRSQPTHSVVSILPQSQRSNSSSCFF